MPGHTQNTGNQYRTIAPCELPGRRVAPVALHLMGSPLSLVFSVEALDSKTPTKNCGAVSQTYCRARSRCVLGNRAAILSPNSLNNGLTGEKWWLTSWLPRPRQYSMTPFPSLTTVMVYLLSSRTHWSCSRSFENFLPPPNVFVSELNCQIELERDASSG
jgi:hypothetical protein